MSQVLEWREWYSSKVVANLDHCWHWLPGSRFQLVALASCWVLTATDHWIHFVHETSNTSSHYRNFMNENFMLSIGGMSSCCFAHSKLSHRNKVRILLRLFFCIILLVLNLYTFTFSLKVREFSFLRHY